ncbi:MAG: hypothetical protein LBH19_15890 [Dysgonamonadaceae bacterium]|jgi:hypothetical protein|nr:hypothetical protein [Dysgonamonadaceae bacterium]
MKKIQTTMLILLSAVISVSAFAQNKQKVAVYVTGGETNGINEFIGAYLVDAIVNGSSYLAVERTADFIKELNKEQEYQASGAVDDGQISQLGQQFGVDLVCVAKVGKMGSRQFVSARLIDVISATVKSSTKPVMFTMDDVDKSCAVVAVSLLRGEEKEEVRRPTVAETSQPISPANGVHRTIAANSAPKPYENLTCSKMDIYSNGMLLDKEQVSRAFAAYSPAALDLYNSARTQNGWGKGLVIGGYIVGGLGVVGYLSLIAADALEYSSGMAESCLLLGGGALISGYCLKSSAKRKVRSAVDTYNRAGQTSYVEYNFGFTQNGVGLVIAF